MLNDFRKILSLFNKEEKSKGYKLLILVSIMALIEVFSIASIFPFISLIANKDLIYNQTFLFKIYTFTALNNENNFIILIGFICLLFFTFSLIFKSLSIYSQILYVEICESGLSKRIFSLYINYPYDTSNRYIKIDYSLLSN